MTNTALRDLLPPQRTRQLRTRSHNYILPRVQTSRFKAVFINRCLFNRIELELIFPYSSYCHVNCCKSVCAMNS